VLAQAKAAFQRTAGAGRGDRKKDEKIVKLEAKLAQKNEVIAELMEDGKRPPSGWARSHWTSRPTT